MLLTKARQAGARMRVTSSLAKLSEAISAFNVRVFARAKIVRFSVRNYDRNVDRVLFT